jgi:hypothetical protein
MEENAHPLWLGKGLLDMTSKQESKKKKTKLRTSAPKAPL